MSRRRRNPKFRTAFTLVESLAVVVVLAVAIPPAVSMMVDSAQAQMDSVKQTRATWFAAAILEHIIADANSDDPALGFEALSDAGVYIKTANVGLNDRLADVIALYNGYGLSYTVQIGALSNAGGKVTGDANEDAFRTIIVGVTWTTPRGDSRTLDVGAVVTDL